MKGQEGTRQPGGPVWHHLSASCLNGPRLWTQLGPLVTGSLSLSCTREAHPRCASDPDSLPLWGRTVLHHTDPPRFVLPVHQLMDIWVVSTSWWLEKMLIKPPVRDLPGGQWIKTRHFPCKGHRFKSLVGELDPTLSWHSQKDRRDNRSQDLQ